MRIGVFEVVVPTPKSVRCVIKYEDRTLVNVDPVDVLMFKPVADTTTGALLLWLGRENIHNQIFKSGIYPYVLVFDGFATDHDRCVLRNRNYCVSQTAIILGPSKPPCYVLYRGSWDLYHSHFNDAGHTSGIPRKRHP
jgi:hypothetical protein